MDRATWDRLDQRGRRLAIERPATTLNVLASKVAVLCTGAAIAAAMVLVAAVFDEPGRLGLGPSAAGTATRADRAGDAAPVGLPAASAPGSQVRRVGNTAGEGVYLRRTPRADDRLLLLAEGTAVQALGTRVEAGGLSWLKVRGPNGDEGWLPEQYLLPP